MDSGSASEETFRALMGCMPLRLQSMSGPSWFRSTKAQNNWPRFVRQVVEDVASVTVEDDPSGWVTLAASEALKHWARVLMGVSVDHLRGLLANRPVAGDQARWRSWREQVRRTSELVGRLSDPASDWLDFLELGPSDDLAGDLQLGGWSERAQIWLRQLAALNSRTWPSYMLRFPVVDPDDTTRKHVIDAVVTLCPRVDLGPRIEPGRIISSPWSLLACEPSAMRDLASALASLIESGKGEFSFLRDRNVLLELRPTEVMAATDLLPRPGDTIEGTSLGLAVFLACWASQHKPLFRRVVLTGAIHEQGIGTVGDVDKKFEAVCTYAEDLQSDCIFLAPKKSQEARHLPGNNRRVHIELIDTWKSLLEVIPKLLTDGFDGYRQRLVATPHAWPDIETTDDFGVWSSADQDEIQASIDRLLASEPPSFEIITLPFGNDPAIVARNLVGALCKAIRDGAATGRRFAGESFVPVLVPLDQLDPKVVSPLEEAVIKGMRTWAGVGEAGIDGAKDDWPSESWLRMTVRSFPQQLSLVMYGQESRNALAFDQLELRVKTLLEPSASRPGSRSRAVLIASDEHQRQLLEPMLRSFAKSRSS